MCLKYRKSKTSEILEISRNKCTLKIGCVLVSLQVARCLSSGEQRHNHPLDRHPHRRHISVEEDLKSTPTAYLITDLLAFFRNLDAIVDLAKDKVALS